MHINRETFISTSIVCKSLLIIAGSRTILKADVLSNDLIMEEIQPSSLFSLFIDPVTKTHLLEAARWAKFLSIAGIACTVLMLVGGIAYSYWLTTVFQITRDFPTASMNSNDAVVVTIISAIIFLVWAIILFFPLVYMLRFANQMKIALNGNDQQNLNASFQNLKRLFRYVGVVTIIGAVLSALWVIFVGIAMATLR